MTSMKVMVHFFLILTFTLFTWVGQSDARISSKWNFCDCEWESWQPWSVCDKKCWGSRTRTRRVYTTCTNFTDCASIDMGWDSDKCNAFCFNGGSAEANNVCNCPIGWTGTCCDQVTTCGTPRNPTNGNFHGSSFNFADIIFYSCKSGYNISGDLDSSCQWSGVWSGNPPECVYVNYCSSSPCQNGADCVEGLNQYTCSCTPGFNGQHCENDVQPPVFENCSDSFTVYTTSDTVTATWTVPQFSDPLGHPVELMSRNYDTNEVDFPRGDFTVQYVALKRSNGLRAECVFNISVRPTPCVPLTAPEGGAVVCNGWVSDYARVCQIFCKDDKSLSLGEDHRQQYVCGADGQWTPSLPLPKCTASQPCADEAVNKKYNEEDYKFSSCEDTNKMATTYLRRLESSGFKDLCHNYPDQCQKDNVNVICR